MPTSHGHVFLICLMVLFHSLSEVRQSLGKDNQLIVSSATASSTWPSFTVLSRIQRAETNLHGEEFGSFPQVGKSPLVVQVQAVPIAGPTHHYVRLARTQTALHSTAHTTVLGDLYLADDRPLIAAEGAHLLASTAVLLDRDRAAHLTLEAYCDERGTEAYNLVVGQDWVLDVSRRLQGMRIGEDRITGVSYGTQQPACQHNSTTCWEDNLRMKWSIRLLSPIESHQGCLVRLRVASSTLHSGLAASEPYLRRIQQGESLTTTPQLPAR